MKTAEHLTRSEAQQYFEFTSLKEAVSEHFKIDSSPWTTSKAKFYDKVGSDLFCARYTSNGQSMKLLKVIHQDLLSTVIGKKDEFCTVMVYFVAGASPLNHTVFCLLDTVRLKLQLWEEELMNNSTAWLGVSVDPGPLIFKRS